MLLIVIIFVALFGDITEFGDPWSFEFTIMVLCAVGGFLSGGERATN